MSRIEALEASVDKLYVEQRPERTDWADWLFAHHVFIVADNATTLAERFNGNPELSRAAALLHDIADTRMSRFAEKHETASLEIARQLMQEAGFNQSEIELAVDDAIRYHSCHEGNTPKSIEGKILATADSLAHLQTDFYVFATWALAKEKGLEDVKSWVLKKIDRDYNNKILFATIRDELQEDYERLRVLFSR